jgi:hypothetical protein
VAQRTDDDLHRHTAEAFLLPLPDKELHAFLHTLQGGGDVPASQECQSDSLPRS